MAEEEKGQRWPSNAELATQERLDTDDAERVGALQGQPGTVSDVKAPYAVEDNDTSAYVGVAPEYMTYANDTEKPLRAEGGVEGALEEELLGQDRVVAKVEQPEGNQTQGGGTTHETVYPAVSGEDFSSKVARVTPDKAKAPGQSDGSQAKKAAPSRPTSPAGQGDTGGQ